MSLSLSKTTKKKDHGPIVEHGGQKNRVCVRYNTSKYMYMNSNGRIFVPSDTVLNGIILAELGELLFRYQETIEVVCQRQRYIGEEFDGGYHACETLV